VINTILPSAGISLFLGYIGPGAGFAFIGSFLILLVALVMAIISVLLLPLRLLLAAFRSTGRKSASLVKRAVVVGMDGLDPRRLRDMMDRGELPNFKSMSVNGTFSELATTCPPISPVAWSTFMTGVNPGKHNVFDFLNRDLKTCIPELSSCRVETRVRKGWFLRRAAEVRMLRKSTPFWKILGDHGVASTVLRVPVTFPAEPFRGRTLAGMCVPDLRGTQGTFTVLEEIADTSANGASAAMASKPEGGLRIPVKIADGRIDTSLPGPVIDRRTLTIPVSVRIGKDHSTATISISGKRVHLRLNTYSDWISVEFRDGMHRICGICRFLLLSVAPKFKLYVTPLHIDPERPAMPISHPPYYSIYLGKLHGAFATLGLSEDTWALNEGVIDDAAFLRQAFDIQKEREDVFFEALRLTRSGMCACVFDLPDRIQHMFYRYVDEKHPARHDKTNEQSCRAIDDVYRTMDKLLGRVMSVLGEDSALIVLSDHGFSSFRRGVDLNSWLAQEGYLVRRASAPGNDYLTDVDWEKTRAYSFGLSGIYINVRGRETHGIVTENGEKLALKQEIAAKLLNLCDPANGGKAIHGVYDSSTVYSGPYSDNGPDLVVGYEAGYRASWETAKGSTAGSVFTDNTKCWSGDHCIDPELVPGVLLCNGNLDLQSHRPHIADLAPTILRLFGVGIPKYMDGKPLDLKLTGVMG